MRPDEVMVRLDEERMRHAQTALAAPAGDLFAYGRACGYYAGLVKARLIYEETISADAERRLNI